MHLLHAQKGFLVYPIREKDDKEIDDGKLVEARIRELNGFSGTIGRLPFFIPQGAENEDDFEKQMEKAETAFLKSLTEQLNPKTESAGKV